MSLTFGVVERRVVDQNLDGIRAPIDDALHRNVRQQVRQAAGLGVVVAALLRKPAAGRRSSARLGGGQTVFGIEQNGAGVRRQDLR